ncbi:hypothetical protein TanjilG_27695 [Lupinus angustifolius]|uniref:Uncharacterized protein n=1 Tax=Lupinus angustifolius TaxID=3871 RepID=A0A4P1RH70_LUPAN|nr:hypothetical protein TanjilG_27695 [Lupinus angustifolius]
MELKSKRFERWFWILNGVESILINSSASVRETLQATAETLNNIDFESMAMNDTCPYYSGLFFLHFDQCHSIIPYFV